MEPELVASFGSIPVNRHFGFRLVERSAQSSIVEAEPRNEWAQETGIVHGGVVTALADTAAVYTFFPDLEPGRTMTSIEFKVNFLRPALVDRGPLVARATVVRRGAKVGLCDVEVAQQGKLLAKGLFTYLFFEPRTPSSA